MHHLKLKTIAVIALATGWSSHATDTPNAAITTTVSSAATLVAPAVQAAMVIPSPNGAPLPPHLMRKGTSPTAKNAPRAPMPVHASPYMADTRQTDGFAPAIVLKGLHLGLRKQDLQNLLPALNYSPEGSAQTLEVGTYSCGTAPAGHDSTRPTPKGAECNFTLGGEPVQSISLRYWGDHMTMASLTFAKTPQPKAQWQRLQDGINYKYSGMEKVFMTGVWNHLAEELVLEQEQQNSLTLTHTLRAQSLYMASEAERMSHARKERQARAAAIAQDM